MSPIEFYVVTLAILAAINAITVIGLKVQFGTAGLLNLAYIVLLAIGAYATGVVALPKSAPLPMMPSSGRRSNKGSIPCCSCWTAFGRISSIWRSSIVVPPKPRSSASGSCWIRSW